jgi:hypothetical protein
MQVYRILPQLSLPKMRAIAQSPPEARAHIPQLHLYQYFKSMDCPWPQSPELLQIQQKKGGQRDGHFGR